MKEDGWMIRKMGKVFITISTQEKNTKENGLTEKSRVKEFTTMRMVMNT